MEAKAVNVIKFSARGFKFLNGELKVESSFKIASKTVKNPAFLFLSSEPIKLFMSFNFLN